MSILRSPVVAGGGAPPRIAASPIANRGGPSLSTSSSFRPLRPTAPSGIASLNGASSKLVASPSAPVIGVRAPPVSVQAPGRPSTVRPLEAGRVRSASPQATDRLSSSLQAGTRGMASPVAVAPQHTLPPARSPSPLASPARPAAPAVLSGCRPARAAPVLSKPAQMMPVRVSGPQARLPVVRANGSTTAALVSQNGALAEAAAPSSSGQGAQVLRLTEALTVSQATLAQERVALSTALGSREKDLEATVRQLQEALAKSELDRAALEERISQLEMENATTCAGASNATMSAGISSLQPERFASNGVATSDECYETLPPQPAPKRQPPVVAHHSTTAASMQFAGEDGEGGMAKGERQRLAEGVEVAKSGDEEDGPWLYEITNQKLSILELTAVFGPESENIGWKEAPDCTKRCIDVPPMSTSTLGTIEILDDEEDVGLDIRFSWNYRKPDPEALAKQKEQAEAEEGDVQVLIGEMTSNGILASELGSRAAIEAACRQAGLRKFVDAEFPPAAQSLFRYPKRHDNAAVVWRRPDEFLEGEPVVFKVGIHQDDIKQGALGDCWFLASLGALAEYPSMIKDVFVNSMEASEFGVYEMRVWKNGKETIVIVDDYFPCSPGGEPCYGHTNDSELWVALMEKAWAKLHGNYELIEGGEPYQAIMDICGSPGMSWGLKSEEVSKMQARGTFFNMLGYWSRYGYILVAGSPGKDEMTKHRGAQHGGGIVPGHAYTIQQIKRRDNIQLLNLRNPWGKYEWLGDWSDKSPLWTDEMITYFNPRLDDEDGSFWMSEEDFLANFSDVHVVFHRGQLGISWGQASMEVTPQEGEDLCATVLEFDVEVFWTGWFNLIQQDMRQLTAPDYTELSLGVYGPFGAEDYPPREIVRGEPTAARELLAKVTSCSPAPPGKFYAAVYNPTLAAGAPVVLRVYLEKGGETHQNDITGHVVPVTPELREKFALATARYGKTTTESQLRDFKTYGSFMPGGSYALAAECTKAHALRGEFDFSSSYGLELPGTQKLSTEVVLKPKEMALVAELLANAEDASFGIAVKSKRAEEDNDE